MKRAEMQRELSPDERGRRKRYLAATAVTCAAVVMVASAVHVVTLGAGRMDDMRRMASYDIEEMPSRIRAAGEEVARHDLHRANKLPQAGYSTDEAAALLPATQWQELDTVITIPAGAFTMGTNRPRTDPQDRPARVVELPAYGIDKYLVTNAQYARFVAQAKHRPPLHWEGGRIPPGELLRPVTMVSWYDADKYCRWSGKRLPGEAEWEKAARGTDQRRWPWGDQMDPARLNTYYSVGSATDVTAYPKGVSPYGVFDMAGNVNQWVADDFIPYPGSDAPSELFKGKVAVARTPADRAMKVVDMVPVDARYKVLRGGSWKSDPFSTATYHRNHAWPNYASDFFGFRCAADVHDASAGKAAQVQP